MALKLKHGSVFSFLLVTVVLVAAFAFGGYFALTKTGIIKDSTGVDSKTNKFQKEEILRDFDFRDSNGKKKKFIVVAKNEGSGIPVADSYITDSKLTQSTASKIEDLSGDSNLGYAASGVNALGSSLFISASPGEKEKVILVEITVGDATTITLLDENGKVVSASVVNNILQSIQNKCKCSFIFDSWKGNDKFAVKVPTQVDGQYRVTVSAQTGELVNGIERI